MNVNPCQKEQVMTPIQMDIIQMPRRKKAVCGFRTKTEYISSIQARKWLQKTDKDDSLEACPGSCFGSQVKKATNEYPRFRRWLQNPEHKVAQEAKAAEGSRIRIRIRIRN